MDFNELFKLDDVQIGARRAPKARKEPSAIEIITVTPAELAGFLNSRPELADLDAAQRAAVERMGSLEPVTAAQLLGAAKTGVLQWGDTLCPINGAESETDLPRSRVEGPHFVRVAGKIRFFRQPFGMPNAGETECSPLPSGQEENKRRRGSWATPREWSDIRKMEGLDD